MASYDSCRTSHALSDEFNACAKSSSQPAVKQQFKIKRKSDTTYKRKKRKCSFYSNQFNGTNLENAGPCIESLGIIQSSTPKEKSSNNINNSMQSYSHGMPPAEAVQVNLMYHGDNDSMSDFWNDDKMFADLSLNLSGTTGKKIESASSHNSLNPIETNKLLDKRDFPLKEKVKCMPVTEEMFYGMSLEVKQMLLQSRGISELYGE